MQEQLITYETAKLAKEKGFDAPCRGYIHVSQYDRLSLPTQSLLQKWLREKYDILIEVTVHYPIDEIGKEYDVWIIGKEYDVWIIKNKYYEDDLEGYNTYEEALEEGLYESLKLI